MRDISLEKSAPDFADRRLWELLSACPLCGEEKLQRVVNARDWHYGNPGQFTVVRCQGCGAFFLNPMPTLAYLSAAYPRNYYAYATPSGYQKQSRHEKQIRRMIHRCLCFTSGWTGDPEFPEAGRLLDIGCGAGYFMSEMRDKGWDVCGVELDSEAAVRGRLAGLDIFAGTLHDAAFPDSSFEYVRSNHSFEHIHNPRETLREIHRIIQPNGLLFLGVPNLAGFMARIWGPYWWYLGAPVHTFGYTPASLSRLLAQEKFQVVKVRYNSTFGGTIGSLQIWMNRNKSMMSEEGWMMKSLPLRLLGHWIARIADLFHAGDCMEITARPVSD